jgi:hypothetical protein
VITSAPAFFSLTAVVLVDESEPALSTFDGFLRHYRICFFGFRSRTPAPPPFPWMNATPASSSGRGDPPPSLLSGPNFPEHLSRCCAALPMEKNRRQSDDGRSHLGRQGGCQWSAGYLFNARLPITLKNDPFCCGLLQL